MIKITSNNSFDKLNEFRPLFWPRLYALSNILEIRHHAKIILDLFYVFFCEDQEDRKVYLLDELSIQNSRSVGEVFKPFV